LAGIGCDYDLRGGDGASAHCRPAAVRLPSFEGDKGKSGHAVRFIHLFHSFRFRRRFDVALAFRQRIGRNQSHSGLGHKLGGGLCLAVHFYFVALVGNRREYGDFYVVNVKISLDNCDRISASKGSVYGHLFISGFNKAYKGSIYVDDVTLTVDKKSVVKQNYENGKNSGCWYYLNRSEKEYTPAVVSFSGKTLDVTKTSLAIKKGKKATIKATAMPKTKIAYQSKNKKVATVNSKGVVRGIRKGKTTILVTANGKTVKVQITVK